MSTASAMLVIGIALGGALGAVLRFLLERYLKQGILLANILSCFFLGALYAKVSSMAADITSQGSSGLSGDSLTILTVGILGSLGTFATVSLQSAEYWTQGYRLKGSLVWAAHLSTGFAAAIFGIELASWLWVTD